MATVIRAQARVNSARGKTCPVCGAGPGAECANTTNGGLGSRLMRVYEMNGDAFTLPFPMHIDRVRSISPLSARVDKV